LTLSQEPSGAEASGTPEIGSLLGVARRRPQLALPKTEWAQADIARDDLEAHFDGATP
jgi:UDP-glucose 4-epimerase